MGSFLHSLKSAAIVPLTSDGAGAALRSTTVLLIFSQTLKSCSFPCAELRSSQHAGRVWFVFLKVNFKGAVKGMKKKKKHLCSAVSLSREFHAREGCWLHSPGDHGSEFIPRAGTAQAVAGQTAPMPCCQGAFTWFWSDPTSQGKRGIHSPWPSPSLAPADTGNQGKMGRGAINASCQVNTSLLGTGLRPSTSSHSWHGTASAGRVCVLAGTDCESERFSSPQLMP